MSFDLGKVTNKGTAMMKFVHQFQPGVILPDDYVGWFFDHSIAKFLQEDILGLSVEPTNDVE